MNFKLVSKELFLNFQMENMFSAFNKYKSYPNCFELYFVAAVIVTAADATAQH